MLPFPPSLGAFTVTLVSPFLMTKSFEPSPEISSILPRFLANFTARSLLVFTTLMLFSDAPRAKFSPPLMVKVSPKSRCTLPLSVVSSPVKFKPFAVAAAVAAVPALVILLDKSL